MSFLSRIGLAIVRPRTALGLAGNRDYAGRSGSDLLGMIAILLVATQLRWLVSAAWLGFAVAANLGLQALMHVLTTTLTMELVLLVIAAAVVFVASGSQRELGRAFDIACVAALAPVLVHLVAQTVISIGNLGMPPILRWTVEGISLGWMSALLALAAYDVWPRSTGIPAARTIVTAPLVARRAGWIVATVALAGLAVQAAWIAGNLELVRPLQTGGSAPAFALAKIGPGGKLGAKVSRTPGRLTVIDFWATWCGPCLHAMPHMDRIARAHPEIDVIAINLDDPEEIGRAHV